MELASPGFSVYLTISWPNPRVFRELVESIQDCTDYMELGIPSKRPMYDGPTIRRTHMQVMGQGIGVDDALEVLVDTGVERPFILMAYMSEHGLGPLIARAARVGAASILLPDLPFEYPERIQSYVEEARRAGLRPSLFASPKFPHHLLEEYGRMKPLLVYLGLQPATGVRLPARMLDNIALARRLLGQVYLLAGFSISTGEQASRIIRAGASGVVVGSHIIRAAERGGVDAAAREACTLYEAVHGVG